MNCNVINTESVIQRLRQAGLKITPQRVSILSELVGNRDHPTADMVYQKIKQKLPNISFDTVNRALIVFAQKGVLGVAEVRGGPKRYDSVTSEHHHFHCIKCGDIIDFDNDDYNTIKLPEKITKDHQVIGKRVVLEGVCGFCS